MSDTYMVLNLGTERTEQYITPEQEQIIRAVLGGDYIRSTSIKTGKVRYIVRPDKPCPDKPCPVHIDEDKAPDGGPWPDKPCCCVGGSHIWEPCGDDSDSVCALCGLVVNAVLYEPDKPCPTCGGSGAQVGVEHDHNGNPYPFPIGPCETCHGSGKADSTLDDEVEGE